MSTARSGRRITTGALAVTLTAGALVVATGPVATAGTGSTTYTCTFPAIGAVPVPVSATVPDLPAVPAGVPVAAGALDPGFVFDATGFASVWSLVTSPSTSGMDLGLSDGTSIPLQTFSFGTLSGTSLPASATSSGFTAPAAPGDYDLSMPEAFSFTGLLAGSPVVAPCVTDAAAVLGKLTVVPGEDPALMPSTTDATLVKKRIMKGRRATIDVTSVAGVEPLTMPASGEVAVRKGKRVIATKELVDGTTRLRTKRFRKPGRYTLTVKYLGDAVTAPSSDKVVLRVLRRRR